VESPRLQYLKQVARSTGAGNYTAMKRMACNIPYGKLPTNQMFEEKEVIKTMFKLYFCKKKSVDKILNCRSVKFPRAVDCVCLEK
jgi:hypothetical protein